MPIALFEKSWPSEAGHGWKLQRLVINFEMRNVKEIWCEDTDGNKAPTTNVGTPTPAAMKAMKTMKTMKAMKAMKSMKSYEVDEQCANGGDECYEDDEVQEHEGCECYAEECYESEEGLAYESEEGLSYESDEFDESYEVDETCANGCDEGYGDDEVYEHEEGECGAEELRL